MKEKGFSHGLKRLEDVAMKLLGCKNRDSGEMSKLSSEVLVDAAYEEF